MPPERHSMNEADGEILTLDEVAAYLKAGKKTPYRLAHLGQIPGVNLGCTWRVRRSDLARWVGAKIAEKARGRTCAPRKTIPTRPHRPTQPTSAVRNWPRSSPRPFPKASLTCPPSNERWARALSLNVASAMH